MSQYNRPRGSYWPPRGSFNNDGGRNQSLSRLESHRFEEPESGRFEVPGSRRFEEPYPRRHNAYQNEYQDQHPFDSTRQPRRLNSNRFDYSGDEPYSQSSDSDQFSHLEQYPPHRNKFQPELSHGSPPYPPRNRFHPQDPPQSQYVSNDRFVDRGPNHYHPDVDEIRGVNSFNTNQRINNNNNQLPPPISAAPFSRNVDNIRKDEIMNHSGSLKEKYTEAVNAFQPLRRNLNDFDKQSNQEPFKSQTKKFSGPSRSNLFSRNLDYSNKDEQFKAQLTDFSGPSQSFANDVEFKSPNQFFFETEDDDCFVSHDDFNRDHVDKNMGDHRKKYIKAEVAQQKKVKKQMDKNLEKKSFNNMREPIQKRNRNKTRRLFTFSNSEKNPDEEARYAEEYKLIEHVPPVTKDWSQITIDDIKNRDGPVGDIVVIFTKKVYHSAILENTAKAWNMSFVLKSEKSKSDKGKGLWTATAIFNDVELAKTQSEDRAGARNGTRHAACARALWKLYQWYFVLKKGGVQSMGDETAQKTVISPNRASQVGNKHLRSKFQNQGKKNNLNVLKKQIELYAKDDTNLNDLVISEDFNHITQKILLNHAKQFECINTNGVHLKFNSRVVLKKIGKSGPEPKFNGGWNQIEEILKKQSLDNTFNEYVLYRPGDFSHGISYKYPNVTYLIP